MSHNNYHDKCIGNISMTILKLIQNISYSEVDKAYLDISVMSVS